MISQEVDLVAGDFNGTVVAAETISVQWNSVVVTRIHSEQLGRRLWISQTTWFSTLLESKQTCCLLHPSEALGLRPNGQLPSKRGFI